MRELTVKDLPGPGALPTGFGPFGISLIAFPECGFFVRVAEVQLGMSALGLEHIRSLHELPRLPSVSRLALPFSSRWLVFAVAALIGHTSRFRKRHAASEI